MRKQICTRFKVRVHPAKVCLSRIENERRSIYYIDETESEKEEENSNSKYAKDKR